MRRAQLVRDTSDEIHLEIGQALGAARRHENGDESGGHQQQDGERDGEVAETGLGNDGVERTRAVTHAQLEPADFGARIARARRLAHAGRAHAAEQPVVLDFQQRCFGVGHAAERNSAGAAENPGGVRAVGNLHVVILQRLPQLAAQMFRDE